MMPDSIKPHSVKSPQWPSLMSALLLAGMFTALLLAVTPQSGNARTATTTVWLDTPGYLLGMGDIITVTVRISDVAGLYAGEFGLDFAPGLVNVLDADLGKDGIQITLGDCLVPQFAINEADNTTGYITYTVIQLNPTPPFTGSCAMAHISFQALQEGAVPITFDRLTLSDRYGNSISTGSREITLTTDGTPPTSTIAAPQFARRAPITVTWIATDTLSTVTAVELWAKTPGGSWCTTAQTGSGTMGAFNYTPLAGDGAYHFATVATDLAGNGEPLPTGDGDARTVYDTTAPDSVPVAPASASRTPITITWVATETLSGVYSVTLSYRFDGGDWMITGMPDLTGTGFVFDFPYGEGAYDFATRAADRAGNMERLPDKPEATTVYQVYDVFLPMVMYLGN